MQTKSMIERHLENDAPVQEAFDYERMLMVKARRDYAFEHCQILSKDTSLEQAIEIRLKEALKLWKCPYQAVNLTMMLLSKDYGIRNKNKIISNLFDRLGIGDILDPNGLDEYNKEMEHTLSAEV